MINTNNNSNVIHSITNIYYIYTNICIINGAAIFLKMGIQLELNKKFYFQQLTNLLG